jgi:hypothetical protein
MSTRRHSSCNQPVNALVLAEKGGIDVAMTRFRSSSSMQRSFIDLFCGNEPLAFESDFGLDESVFRLAAEVVKPPLQGWRFTVVVGNVSKEHVSLWCERLFIRNGFRPVFNGRFQTYDKRVILIGKMELNAMAYPFVGAGLAMGSLFTLATLLELIKGKGSDDPALWVMPFAGVFSVLFLFGMVRFVRWLSSGDEDWILAVIRSTILK